MHLQNQLWIPFFCLFCFPCFLQGQNNPQYQSNGQPNGGQPNGGQPNGGQPNGGQPNGGQYNGGQPNGGQPNGRQPNGPSNNGEAEEYCFDKATKPIYQKLGFCKCEVYERFKTFVGPDLSPIFKAIGKSQEGGGGGGGGGKKKSCKPQNPLLVFLYSFNKYGFYQVKTCFWEKLGLLVDKRVKWENLVNILHDFHMPQEKRENITKSIEDCKDNAADDENEEDKDDEEKDDDEETLDLENKSPQELGEMREKFLKKVEAAVEKSKRGGMNKTDYKVGTCIKEKLDVICADFKENKPSYNRMQPRNGEGESQNQQPGGGGQNMG